MTFDFSISPRVRQWRDGISRFLDEEVLPREQGASDGVDDALRHEVQQAAKRAGLWAPQAAAEVGGGGFAFDEAAVLLEEAGGGLGTSEELVVGRIYADIRAFRIYDGASEVHRMSIARHVVRRAG